MNSIKSLAEKIAETCDYVILVGNKQPLIKMDSKKNITLIAKFTLLLIKMVFRNLGDIVALNDVVLIENDLPYI